MDIIPVGNFKKYGKFREQAICTFTYDGWKLTIHPDILRQDPSYHIYQILFEGYGFCITLGDNCGVARTYTQSLTFQAPLFNNNRKYDNWRGPFGKNKFLMDYQMKGFKKLRSVLKLFSSPQNFIHTIRNDLKYKGSVPQDNGYGISIGSRSNLNPKEHPENAYSVFNKEWLLKNNHNYDLDEPLKDLNSFYNKLLPKINEINRKWQGARRSGRNMNDVSVFDKIKENGMLREINLTPEEREKEFRKFITQSKPLFY